MGGFKMPSRGSKDGMESIWTQIERALDGLKFGSVELTVHEGEVVQIERKEKVRLPRGSNRGQRESD